MADDALAVRRGSLNVHAASFVPQVFSSLGLMSGRVTSVQSCAFMLLHSEHTHHSHHVTLCVCNGSLCNPYGEPCNANADPGAKHSIGAEQHIRVASDAGVCRAAASEAADHPELFIQKSGPRYVQGQPWQTFSSCMLP